MHLFVCNEEEDIKYAFEVGATGVMTDYPSLLTSYLRRNSTQDWPQPSSTQDSKQDYKKHWKIDNIDGVVSSAMIKLVEDLFRSY